MRQGCDTSFVLRKGAWTAEEDTLLKKCIEKFGEGKWHLVPHRAGLSRCRKSCRLRWLNYLRPNIKRGDFDEDEVDLMLRLHKLLGNRWSLIAGRIPGRTANDVKNYWNTHLRSRVKQQKDQLKAGEPSQQTMGTIVKPQPRTISKNLNLYRDIIAHDNTNFIRPSDDGNGTNNTPSIAPVLVSPPTMFNDKINEKQVDNEVEWSFGGLLEEGVEAEDGQNSLFDFPIDNFMWDLLDSSHL
ncbi:hypothetical protein QVD17_04880 [Tagetes erecta]|uniref:Uncharacterized protein n=1 Tax=Tagetes erecta TaxID=13708 RepID=A0AAD8P4X4_TARER|nr:hypothetical protein QVD17_04880 [Tagetes erecta]